MEKIADGFRGEKAIILPYNIRKQQSQNQITSPLYVTHIGYYPNAKHHFRERQEGAPENIFIYCEDGTGWVRTDRGEVHLSKHQAYILPAGKAHVYGSGHTNPWSIYWLHFSGKKTSVFESITDRLITIPESDNSRFADRFTLFEEMYQNLEMGYSPENLEYVSICLTHFLGSIKYINQFREIKKVKETDVIQRSIVFMKDNLEKKIQLEDIAANVGYSVSHFGALFSERTSYSPMVYYNQLKIQRACSLLQFSDQKISEIAYRLGYYDPFHFSKAFRHEMEISPKEYRKRYYTRYNISDTTPPHRSL